MGEVIAPILHALAVEMIILDPAAMTMIRTAVLVGPFANPDERTDYANVLHMSARAVIDSIGEPVVDMVVTDYCDIPRMQARLLYAPGFTAFCYARLVRLSLKSGVRTALPQQAPPQWSLVPTHHRQ